MLCNTMIFVLYLTRQWTHLEAVVTKRHLKIIHGFMPRVHGSSIIFHGCSAKSITQFSSWLSSSRVLCPRNQCDTDAWRGLSQVFFSISRKCGANYEVFRGLFHCSGVYVMISRLFDGLLDRNANAPKAKR